MITHAASRKHYYTVLLDRTESGSPLIVARRVAFHVDCVEKIVA